MDSLVYVHLADYFLLFKQITAPPNAHCQKWYLMRDCQGGFQ